MKDFYDVFLIMSIKKDQINRINLKNAVIRTFKKRQFEGDLIINFLPIKESSILESKWKSYTRRKRITELSYDQVVKAIEELIIMIIPIQV